MYHKSYFGHQVLRFTTYLQNVSSIQGGLKFYLVSFSFRETNSIEQHSEALVSLLESCLNHNLKPSPRDEDPPHAKISSDIISCIFLVSKAVLLILLWVQYKVCQFFIWFKQNYNKKEVMRRSLPVAVKFLHKGNKELSRNMSSYLSLAAIENADLLSKHIQLIIDSIISGKSRRLSRMSTLL